MESKTCAEKEYPFRFNEFIRFAADLLRPDVKISDARGRGGPPTVGWEGA